MMEHKRNTLGHVPRLGQDIVRDALVVRTVIPMGQIRSTVTILRRELHLDIVNASFAFESERVKWGLVDKSSDILKNRLLGMSIRNSGFVQSEQIL